MSDGNALDKSVRQKRTRFSDPAAPSGITVLEACGSPIAAACYLANFRAMILHDKLAKIVVRCAAYFMMRRQNLHYKIPSQKKVKTDNEYVPKSAQIKLELAVEKGEK